MKKYDFTTFNFKGLNGEELEVTCFTYETQYNWGHRCYVFYNNMQLKEEKITYYNRTWECFKYESLLKKVIEKIYPGKKQKIERDFLRKQVHAIADREREEVEKWATNFMKAFNNLSENAKNALADSDILLNSREEADATLKALQALDAVNNLFKDEAKSQGLYNDKIKRSLAH